MMPIEPARDADIELANTVEAYTFLTTHIIRNFRSRFRDFRARRTLRHAVEHITGTKMQHPILARLRAIRLASHVPVEK